MSRQVGASQGVQETVVPLQGGGRTSLTNPAVRYQRWHDPYFMIQRGPITAVIVDNSPVDDQVLPGHRAGYHGIGRLEHVAGPGSPLVPSYSGLNFEHIHDGTLAVAREKFEPRRAPMELRVVDPFTAELYQAPTPNWYLESCGRYHVLEDGVIEYVFECIARREVFRQGWAGLFWASYIQQPQDRAIYFRGRAAGEPPDASRWIRAESPQHGVAATHPPAGPRPALRFDPDFPLTLVNHPSQYVWDEPWYYGLWKSMSWVAMFRRRDRVWFAQSPTGGGARNPAWDFQWFIPDLQVNRPYQLVMRLALLPWTDRQEIDRRTAPHRRALQSP